MKNPRQSPNPRIIIFRKYIMADYKTSHLTWLKQTKNFVPHFSHDYKSCSYYEAIEYTYSKEQCSQERARAWFVADKLYYKQSQIAIKEVDKIVEKSLPTTPLFYFVTIGFSHQDWSIKTCCNAIEKILNMNWVISAKANFELHRENGLHPHVHFVIETNHKKGKIVDCIFKSEYIKKIVLKKNFIDVKPALESHYKYINLEKQESKLGCVDQDRKWRQENNIPDYEKNWKNL